MKIQINKFAFVKDKAQLDQRLLSKNRQFKLNFLLPFNEVKTGLCNKFFRNFSSKLYSVFQFNLARVQNPRKVISKN